MRWKVYAERKQQEIDSRSQEIFKAPSKARREALEVDQSKAKKLFEEDSELFRTHNIARDTFLKQAIDMYSRCLHTSDSFDSDAAIRLCSLWFANFEEHGRTFQDDVQIALERIPSRKFVFLAVSFNILGPSKDTLTAGIASTLCKDIQTSDWSHFQKPRKSTNFGCPDVSRTPFP
jgi:hypothetical protein